MKKFFKWFGGTFVCAGLLMGCGGGKESTSVTPVTPTPIPTTLTSVAVMPSAVTLVVGGTQTFSVVGTYSNGTVSALTTGITWTAGGTVAPVDGTTGSVTAKAAGLETVTATYGALTSQANVKVVTPYLNVGGGGSHAHGVKTDGGLYGWGLNRSGQLGTGNLFDKYAPTEIGTVKTWAKVASGEFHTVALRSDGTLWAWGSNQNGQLGMGNFADLALPTQIGKDKTWVDFAVGAYHTLAVNKAGQLFAWGRNFNGQIGDGTFVDTPTPMEILIPSSHLTATVVPTWTAVAAGADASVARLSNGELWSWGANFHGQLGRQTVGSGSSVSAPQTPGQVLLLKPDHTVESATWSNFAAGGSQMLAIRTNGELYAWGSNLYGKLGIVSDRDAAAPTRVGTDGDWERVAAGQDHSMAIRVNGTLWVWGGNGDGQLGDGSQTPRSQPVQVGTGRDWVKLSAGKFSSYGIRTDGLLFGWGRNAEGQLGNGVASTVRVLVPTPIP